MTVADPRDDGGARLHPSPLPHLLLGAATATAAACAVPAVVGLALIGAEAAGFADGVRWALVFLYGWLLTGWIAQVPLLAPAVALALLRRHYACGAGLALGMAAFALLGLASLGVLVVTGSLDTALASLRSV